VAKPCRTGRSSQIRRVLHTSLREEPDHDLARQEEQHNVPQLAKAGLGHVHVTTDRLPQVVGQRVARLVQHDLDGGQTLCPGMGAGTCDVGRVQRRVRRQRPARQATDVDDVDRDRRIGQQLSVDLLEAIDGSRNQPCLVGCGSL
jgi:hypothetical protein